MLFKCSYCGREFKRTYSHEPKRAFCDSQCFKAWKRGIPLEDLEKPTPDQIKFKRMYGKNPTKSELRQFVANNPSKTKKWGIVK